MLSFCTFSILPQDNYVGLRDESMNKDNHKPVISDVKFNYIFDWQDDMIYPNGIFSFNVYSEGATLFEFNCTRSFLFSKQNLFFSWCKDYEVNNQAHISYDADWGEYIMVAAYSKDFGWVHSDTICTTDYITDEAIINRINELKEQSHIECLLPEDLEVNLTDGNIIFNSDILSATLFDCGGIKQAEIRDSKFLNIASLQKGIYYIIIETKKGDVIRRKILL